MSLVRWLAASGAQRLGAPADIVKVAGGVQTLTPAAFDAYIDLVTKASYKQVSDNGATRVYALVPLGTESGESFQALLARLPVGTNVSVSVDAPSTLPAATDPATTALFSVGPTDNTGAWANFFPPLEVRADGSLAPVVQASWSYDPKNGWGWQCNAGYAWSDRQNPDNFTCVRQATTASSGGGSDSTGLLVLVALGAVVLAVVLGGKS